MNHYTQADANVSCTLNDKILLQITRLRDRLAEMQKAMQDQHLNCCIFPGFHSGTEVARALYELSTKRIGALIALERETSLDQYVTSGTPLNADLSSSLLLSLFYPGNPLHDGAVIIKGTSIVAARCVLPLSRRDTLFTLKGKGLRHRAGVGLSQVSDATVLIVSEETGTVSMARAGKLLEINLGARSQPGTRWSANSATPDNVVSLH